MFKTKIEKALDFLREHEDTIRYAGVAFISSVIAGLYAMAKTIHATEIVEAELYNAPEHDQTVLVLSDRSGNKQVLYKKAEK